jgi:hypothetical protein
MISIQEELLLEEIKDGVQADQQLVDENGEEALDIGNDDLVDDVEDFKSEDNESSEGPEKIDLPFKQVRKIKC